MTLTATVPFEYGNAHAVWWAADRINDNGFLETIWTYRSVQDKPSGGWAPGASVRFGAPGLVEDSNIRFRVSFENAASYKLCWSPRSDAFTTLPFDDPSATPSIPDGIYIKVQDDFDRPETDAQDGTPPGDGFGPEDVWTATPLLPNGGHAIRIAADEVTALLAPSTSITYEMREESDAHTFHEAVVRVDLARAGGGSIPYNLQIQARIGEVDQATGDAPSYAVKLVKGIRDCQQASLIPFRLPDEYAHAGCDGATGLPWPDTGGIVCRDATTNEEPPLEAEDLPGQPGLSKPVWLRIEVEDVGNPAEPEITGSVHWQDDQGQWRSCSVTRTDVGDPGSMAATLGKWGLSFHDKWYRLDSISAGDGATP